jgi:hypothetical protein
MPRTCTSCNHPGVRELDDALRAGDASQTELAARYGVTPAALGRHRARHLSRRASLPSSSIPGRLEPRAAVSSGFPAEAIAMLTREDFVDVILHKTGRNRGGYAPVDDPALPGACWDDSSTAGKLEDLTRFPGRVYDKFLAEREAARRRA